jgi:hypothetical protein
MIKKKNTIVFSESDYRIIMQLYYLSKAEKNKAPRIPKADMRRIKVVRAKKQALSMDTNYKKGIFKDCCFMVK